MTDEQARSSVLGNWHKLTAYLQTKPSLEDLRRLMALEMSRGKEARDNVLEKLRSSITSAGSRGSRAAMDSIIGAMELGEMPDYEDVERVMGYEPMAGALTPPMVKMVLDNLRRVL